METALSRNTDPSTSFEAAATVNVTEMEKLVLGLLKKHGSLTQEEAADLSATPRPSISPRFRPLVRKNLIQDTGLRRKNVSGKRAIVFSLTQIGKAQA